MSEQITGYMHSFESGAGIDGPGMRCVVFLSGCDFRCLYCHNPDTWKLKSGTPVTLDDVMAKIKPYTIFLKRAGGVTISGGEPMVQMAFTNAILSECKKLGLHTALDTQGYFGMKATDVFLQNVDLFMLDIKHFDSIRYKELTGCELQPTLDFAKRLADMKKPIWLRYVLVPGWSDEIPAIEKLADFAASLGNVERVDILPFHQLGAHKWDALNLEYVLRDTLPPSLELTEQVREIFRARGLLAV